ncbi:hypothetical protein THO17_32730 [Marinomonas sp. THO17]
MGKDIKKSSGQYKLDNADHEAKKRPETIKKAASWKSIKEGANKSFEYQGTYSHLPKLPKPAC